MVIDGGLNLAETWLALPKAADVVLRVGAVAYGVFPTLAALGLGRLQSSLDRLPTAPTKKATLAGLFDAVLRKLEYRMEQGETQGKQAEQVAGVATQGLQASGGEVAQVAPATAEKDDKGLRKLPLQDAELLVMWEQDPQASDSKLAQVAGVSRQAIQQRRKQLQASGAIRMTDKGVQIVAVSFDSAMAEVAK
jgi:biotin operon repressor